MSYSASRQNGQAREVKSSEREEEPSMTFALFVYWVLPVLIFAAVSRYTVDTEVPTIKVKASPRPVQIKRPSSPPSAHPGRKEAKRSQSPSPQPSASSQWPTAYREVVNTINSRRRRIETGSKITSQNRPASSSPQTTTQGSDKDSNDRSSPVRVHDATRNKFHDKIAMLKQQHERNPEDLFAALNYADAMRYYDLQFHDGGSYEREAIAMYSKVVDLALARRQRVIDEGKPTDESLSGTRNVGEEVTMEYTARSADGILCGVYTAFGKVYFLANMFDRAVECYNKCLELAPTYLDAVNARGSALIILGRYKEAGRDFLQVVKGDSHRLFTDSFQGLARVLQANEESVPDGWDELVSVAEQLIPKLENQLAAYPKGKQMIAPALNRLYHALFLYHDVKTKDSVEAFRCLTESYKHKMSLLAPWNSGSELAKIAQSMNIFREGFWPENVGSQTRVPIFVVGFVRSGSTLLERVLDSHPLIVGTGENSVFNGRLPEIRNQIVQASMTSPETLGDLTRQLAEDVVDEMRRRWEILESNNDKVEESAVREEPQRFVDKMLTNYYNIGFIHMLYPNALILHVAREPMDTLFSAYKHEFPSGTLDYTSDFEGLAELYTAYRDIMKHWDQVLPGRVMHVRYEDMVADMPGVARAIIDAAGLSWDESVLDFHKKKHAVNTLSTTQVRKGIYKDSLKAWLRYEKQLQPLVKLLGDLVDYDLKTSLPGYIPPQTEEPNE